MRRLTFESASFYGSGYGVSGGLRSATLHSGPSQRLLRPASRNLYPSGPSPYICPGVDKPPDTPYPDPIIKKG